MDTVNLQIFYNGWTNEILMQKAHETAQAGSFNFF
jgi:hypothetical protein